MYELCYIKGHYIEGFSEVIDIYKQFIINLKSLNFVSGRRSVSTSTCPIGMEKFASWLI